MEFLNLDYDLITDTRITPREFRLYTYILSIYDEKEECSCVTLETMAKEFGLSVDTVEKSIKKLSELGYMKIEEKKKDGYSYNIYTSLKGK